MNLFQRNPKKVVMMAVFAASFSSIFVKLAEAPPIFVGFYRLTFALPFFAVAVLGWHRSELLAVNKKELLGSGIAGILLSFHFLCWFSALKYTTVASATVICLAYPIIILIISTLFLKEKTNKRAVAGIMVAFVGATIISGGDYSLSPDALLGDLFAFGGALFMALYLLAGKKYRGNINATVYVFLLFTSCWLVFAIEMLVTSTPFTGYEGKTFFWVFVMAMVCQIGAHAVFNWCLGYVKAIYLATWENFEVVIASLLAALIFYEIPTLWQYVGGGITVFGLLYYNRYETDHEEIVLKP